jgi:hypothetical protein
MAHGPACGETKAEVESRLASLPMAALHASVTSPSMASGTARRVRGENMSEKIGRNDPCHCGSGRKYKKCCSAKDDAARSAELAAQAAARAAASEEASTDVAAPGASESAKGAAGRATPNAPSKPKGTRPPAPSTRRKHAV